jgi:hypothetical protein
MFNKCKQSNCNKVFQQWLEFVKEDENNIWVNPRFKNLLTK